MRMRLVIGLLLAAAIVVGSRPAGAAGDADRLLLAENSQPKAVITLADDASAQERTAARTLADYLHQVTGASFEIVSPRKAPQGLAKLAVGVGAAQALEPDLDVSLEDLGQDGIIIQSVPGGLILTGAQGAERGAIFAAYTLLDTIGCRWWSNDWVLDDQQVTRKVVDNTIPHKPTLRLDSQDTRYRPPFEYRDPFCGSGMEWEWSVPNRCVTGTAPGAPIEQGGGAAFYSFDGHFVDAHTFEKIIPPAEYFASHPEWFSEIDGKRVADAQLCLSNPELIQEATKKVRSHLATMPRDRIVNYWIGQNDNERPCTCARCLAIKNEEGSYAGLLLRFVNAVAGNIEDEFPNARIHTLIYRHTRTPPKITRPAENVIIRLCSYECSFAQPLSDGAIRQNKEFAEDLRGWAKLTDRIWIWDYTINFLHYAYPFPNLYSLKPNLEFFRKYGVKGVFEQGNGQTPGGEFSVLRQWVLARLMWDPTQDDKALIRQFLHDYYEEAGPFIGQYIELTHQAAREADLFLSCADDTQFLFTSYPIMAKADDLFAKAREAVKDKPQVLRRVDAQYTVIAYTMASKWSYYREYNRMSGRPWPFQHDTISGYAEDFARGVRAGGLRRLSEAGYEGHGMGTIIQWVKDLPGTAPPLKIPAELGKVKPPDIFVYGAENQKLAGFERGWVQWAADPKSSSGTAVQIPAIHHQWCIQSSLAVLPGEQGARQKWTIYVVLRADSTGQRTGPAVHFGVYDTDMAAKGPTGVPVQRLIDLSEMPDDGEYHLYKLGAAESHPPRYLWLAPQDNPNLKTVWLDRFILVRGER